MLRRLLAAIRRPSGGTLPTYKPSDDSVPVVLSPGWVELPPGSKDRFPPDFIARLFSPRRP